jgi:hypothetical protein
MQDNIKIMLDESNELLFKIQIEGTNNNPSNIRLVCENEDNNIDYVFKGKNTQENNVISFILPELNNILKEGVYKSHVEVIVDNRYFVPAIFNLECKKPVKITAENIQKRNINNNSTQVKISPIKIIASKKDSNNKTRKTLTDLMEDFSKKTLLKDK